MSYYIEFGGIFNERMDLRFDPDGALKVYGGTHSHGQGHATVFAQLVHERLGVPLRSRSATCRATPPRSRSAAAPTAPRSAVVGGNALKAGAEAIIEKGKPLGRRA